MSRDDDITRAEVVALSAQVGSLTQRVYQLEQTIESLTAARPAPTPAPQPSTYVVPRRQPAAPAPTAPRRATPPLRPSAAAGRAATAARARQLVEAGGAGIRRAHPGLGRRHRHRPRRRSAVRAGRQPRMGHPRDAGGTGRPGLAGAAGGRLRSRPARLARRRDPVRRRRRHRRPLRHAVGLDLDLPLHLRGAGPSLRRRHRGARGRPGDPGQAGAAGHLRDRRRDAGTDAGVTGRHRRGSAVLLRDRLRRAAAVLALPVDVAAAVDLGHRHPDAGAALPDHAHRALQCRPGGRAVLLPVHGRGARLRAASRAARPDHRPRMAAARHQRLAQLRRQLPVRGQSRGAGTAPVRVRAAGRCWSLRAAGRDTAASPPASRRPHRPAGRVRAGRAGHRHRSAAGRPRHGLRLGGRVRRHDRRLRAAAAPARQRGGCG